MALSSRSRTVLTLYSARDCVLCHRVRLVLAAKGVSYDLVLVDPAKPPEDLIDLNPYQSVPTLVDRDLVLYDTGVICEYLDERYPHPPLMPVDPLSRARLRLAIVRLDKDWLPLVPQCLAPGKPAEAARKRLRDQLVAAVPLFKAAKFFLNPEMSLADCALAVLVWRLPALGVMLPREAHVIVDYGDRIFRNPGFTRSLTPEERALRE
jgi:RNA polymerase-associated protein